MSNLIEHQAQLPTEALARLKDARSALRFRARKQEAWTVLQLRFQWHPVEIRLGMIWRDLEGSDRVGAIGFGLPFNRIDGVFEGAGLFNDD